MKRIVYALLATVSGLVLLFGYRTSHEATMTAASDLAPAATASTVSSGSSGSATSSSSTSAGTTAGAASSTATGSGTATGLTDGTFTGASVSTRYGDVQVSITVSGGEIVDVQVPTYPDGNGRDRQINERALPVLVSETTSAQSADIQMVSGATFTSRGYLSSLQSAIDQAQS